MKNSIISLKNYLSVFKSRLIANKNAGATSVDFMAAQIPQVQSEQIDFLETTEKALEAISTEFDELESRITALESKKSIPKNQSTNTFVDAILGKIEFLKGIIKSKMGNPDEQIFSLYLITVEAIEQDIKNTGTVTKANLEKLNKIYLSERSQN